MKQITEKEFDANFSVKQNHLDDNAGWSGELYETFGEELKYVFELAKKENRVWTVIEGDEGQYYVSGFHYVNRLGFIITEETFEGDIEVELEY